MDIGAGPHFRHSELFIAMPNNNNISLRFIFCHERNWYCCIAYHSVYLGTKEADDICVGMVLAENSSILLMGAVSSIGGGKEPSILVLRVRYTRKLGLVVCEDQAIRGLNTVDYNESMASPAIQSTASSVDA